MELSDELSALLRLGEWRLKDASWVAKVRERLQSLSWFVKRLKEPLARMANRDDKTRGAFSRGGSEVSLCWMKTPCWRSVPASI